MIKNVIVLGPKWCGKTFICEYLNENYGCVFLNVDVLLKAYTKSFENSDENFNENKKIIASNYIKELADDYNYYVGKKYVIELNGYDQYKYVLKNIDSAKYVIVGLVYDNYTSDDIFKYIRENQTEINSAYYLDDDMLKRRCEGYIEDNKKISELFSNHNIPKFDISINREAVLNTAIKYAEAKTYALKND